MKWNQGVVCGLLASWVLLLTNCKVRHSKREESESGLESSEKMRSLSEEAFTAWAVGHGLMTVTQAGILAGDARGFGREMSERYMDCHVPPQCPNQRLPDSTSGHKEEQAGTAPYCFPNARIPKTKTQDPWAKGFGFWMTGAYQISQQQTDRIRNNKGSFIKLRFNPDSGVQNAARHSYLYCALASEFGYKTIKGFADDHEYSNPEDGVEDTWADYWNNEIGMRFGSRLYRLNQLISGDDAALGLTREQGQEQRRLLFGPIRTYHLSTPAQNTRWDLVDLGQVIVVKPPKDGTPISKLGTVFLHQACKRYLEGVLRGQVEEPNYFHDNTGYERVSFMTHRPSLVTRMQEETFSPTLSASGASQVSFITPPPIYTFPTANAGGLQWLNTAPQPLDPSCIARVPKALYSPRPAHVPPAWQDKPRDYLPSYKSGL